MNPHEEKKINLHAGKTHNNGINVLKTTKPEGNGSTERANKTSETQSEQAFWRCKSTTTLILPTYMGHRPKRGSCFQIVPGTEAAYTNGCAAATDCNQIGYKKHRYPHYFPADKVFSMDTSPISANKEAFHAGIIVAATFLVLILHADAASSCALITAEQYWLHGPCER